MQQALRAHVHYQLDVQYMIKDGQVVIVDEFTGRLMPGRRWSDGLHQAVEAKEGVKIERENQTLATITFQNYFRKYKKLSGMTGTAVTEAAEFAKIYNLDVIAIPTNRDMVRIEEPDLVYRTEAEKWAAIVDDIIKTTEQGRPALVGTVSIEKSERVSNMLKKKGTKHIVLNAKYHAQEAEIVAQAGRKGAVTIATNMAGRGTDILLGGNAEYMSRQQSLNEGVAEKVAKGEEKYVDDDEYVNFFHVDSFYRVKRADWDRIFTHFERQTDEEHKEVVNLGGLHIIGTERHEARRIDNQLRGRAGRQGDPGSSRFFLSLEDDLMRIFGSDRISGSDAAARHGRRRADRAWHGVARHRARAEAGRGLEALRGVDPRLDGLAERLRSALYELEDLGGELRGYEQEVEGEPGRLEEVEERLAALERLERKHGGTIAAVLEHAERCRARRDELAGAEVALERAQGELAEAEAELSRLASALGKARRAAAPRLAERGARAARGAGHGGRGLRGRARRPRRARAGGRRDGRVSHRAQPRRPGGPAARDRLGRRAVAGDARAHGRGRRGPARLRSPAAARRAAAGLRRGRRRHRRAHRPRRRRAAARAGRRAPGRCASRTSRRSPRSPSATSAIEKDTGADPGPRDGRGAAPRRGRVGELVRMLGADEPTTSAQARHAKAAAAA